MAAPAHNVRQPTEGYLLCRAGRLYGCEWSTKYRLRSQREEAEERRRQHELVCMFVPD